MKNLKIFNKPGFFFSFSPFGRQANHNWLNLIGQKCRENTTFLHKVISPCVWIWKENYIGANHFGTFIKEFWNHITHMANVFFFSVHCFCASDVKLQWWAPSVMPRTFCHQGPYIFDLIHKPMPAKSIGIFQEKVVRLIQWLCRRGINAAGEKLIEKPASENPKRKSYHLTKQLTSFTVHKTFRVQP